MKTKAERNADAIAEGEYISGLAEGCGSAFAQIARDTADFVLIQAFARGVRAARQRDGDFRVEIKEGEALVPETFKQALVRFASKNDGLERDFIRAAQAAHNEPGEVEIDDVSIVSFAEKDASDGNPCDGAYVLAWVWVYSADVEGGATDA